MKQLYYLPLLIIGVIAAAASYCSKGDDADPPGSNPNNVTVIMQNDTYSRSSLTITKGTTVTWTNNDNSTHTVTADDNSFNSGDITAGRSFTKTFNEQGTFPYHCIHHPMMKATLIVN